jgi:regulatory protein
LRAEHRSQDLATLGRAGFGYGVARLVVEAEDPESLADEATTRR